MEQKKQTIHLVRQVLKARQWSEESAKGALHHANADLDRDVSARDSIVERVEQNTLALRDAHGSGGARLDLDQIQRLRAWQGHSEAALLSAQSTVDASNIRVDDAREQLGSLVSERRVLQTLQERLVDRVASDEARAQSRLVDETFAAGLSHKQDETHGTR